jgi:UDP-N-acetylglucosamine/UDP-N-acetylgalactosamine diphosphorylase
MAGGTDEKNHSEVGSSYIHFNYTPNQDKATASLIGDVPRGVMLNQPPIFLGGQGGLVGPARIAYGVVTAAGTIVRKDLLKENTMLLGSPALDRSLPFHRGLYGNLRRIIDLNFTYISSLLALRRWYLSVRSRFIGALPMEHALHEGAVRTLDKAVSERVKRLGEVADRMPRSIQLHKEIGTGPSQGAAAMRKREFHERWNDIARHFETSGDRKGDTALQDAFMSALEAAIGKHGKNYLTVIRGLEPGHAEKGTAWLQSLVDDLTKRAWALLPGF